MKPLNLLRLLCELALTATAFAAVLLWVVALSACAS